MIVKKVIQKTDCYKGVFSIEPHPPFFKSFGNSSPIPTILTIFWHSKLFRDAFIYVLAEFVR